MLHFIRTSETLWGQNLILVCRNFFSNGYLQEGLNDSGIVLILEKNSPILMGDLCSIALCNVVYKIIAKILANRMKNILLVQE